MMYNLINSFCWFFSLMILHRLCLCAATHTSVVSIPREMSAQTASFLLRVCGSDQARCWLSPPRQRYPGSSAIWVPDNVVPSESWVCSQNTGPTFLRQEYNANFIEKNRMSITLEHTRSDFYTKFRRKCPSLGIEIFLYSSPNEGPGQLAMWPIEGLCRSVWPKPPNKPNPPKRDLWGFIEGKRKAKRGFSSAFRWRKLV